MEKVIGKTVVEVKMVPVVPEVHLFGYHTHGGIWPVTRSCNSNDLFLISRGTQCGNCGAWTDDLGKTYHPAK